MTNSIEKLVTIIGSREAEEILWAHVHKNFKKGHSKPQESEKKRKRKLPLGARKWSREEEYRLSQRVDELRSQNIPWKQVLRTMAVEFNRTPSAIFNRVFNRVGKLAKAN